VGRLEYLGQTTFNEIRSAVYVVSVDIGLLRLPPKITLRGAAQGVVYYDASSGLELYTQMTLRFRVEAGGQDHTIVMTCQNTLDRGASKGL